MWVGAWDVLMLFLIPIGGGIPAGVLLAKSRGFHWPMMTLLYLISDVILAFVFEPLMLAIVAVGKRSDRVARAITHFRQAWQKSTEKTTARYGRKLGPVGLIMISFGVDPMTGRSAALAAGHGFVTGWAIAIAGDMIYFAMLMVSTLFLSGILGDGTWATIAILVGTTLVSQLLVRHRPAQHEGMVPPTGPTQP